MLQCLAYEVLPCVTFVLQYVAMCYSSVQCVTVRCSSLQCVAVCCSVLYARCNSPDAVCCMVLSVLYIKYIDVEQTKEVML